MLEREMVEPVGLLMFTRRDGARKGSPPDPVCEYCKDVESLLSDFVSLSDLLSLQVLDFDEDRDEAERYEVIRVPVIVPLSDRDHGLRYYGMPSGRQFTPLLQAIIALSNDKPRLARKTVAALSFLESRVNIKVFVSPT